jgi:hypothetical protein
MTYLLPAKIKNNLPPALIGVFATVAVAADLAGAQSDNRIPTNLSFSHLPTQIAHSHKSHRLPLFMQ